MTFAFFLDHIHLFTLIFVRIHYGIGVMLDTGIKWIFKRHTYCLLNILMCKHDVDKGNKGLYTVHGKAGRCVQIAWENRGKPELVL